MWAGVLAWVALGAAAPTPPPSVRGVLAPADLPARWVASEGAQAPTLACEPLAVGVLSLCFQVGEADARRWVTSADLAAWATTTGGLRATVAAALGAGAVGEGAWQPIEGMSARWWLDADGDDREVAALLHPAALAAVLGGAPVRVAVPSMGVVVAWVGDDGDVDHVMAVAVTEMHAKQSRPVSPVVLRWSGSAWIPWAEARPPAAAP
jgi:hypothetical protein